MCARAGCGQQDLAVPAILRACFFEGKKVTNGSAMLLSWQHRAFPFLQLRVGPRVRQKIRAALIAR